MRIDEIGVKHYESDDKVLRLEVRGAPGKQRLVAILDVNGEPVEAELRWNLNRAGLNGRPITCAFEGFLRKHGIEHPTTPLPLERPPAVVAPSWHHTYSKDL